MDVDQDVGREIVDELLPYSLEYFLGIKEFKTEDDAGAEGEEDESEDDEEVEVQPKNKGKDKKKKWFMYIIFFINLFNLMTIHMI